MNTITSLTAQQLRQAAGIKEKLAGLEKQLTGILGATSQPQLGAKKGSATARAKIAAAPVKKAKVKMSAAAKARLSQLAKARWAKVKAAGKKKL